MAKKTYKIPVTWEMCGFIDIEAESLEQAVEDFENNIDCYELPMDNAEYIEASFDLSCREIEYIAMYQDEEEN